MSNWMRIGESLEPMYEAAKLLPSSSYPTMGDVRLAFIGKHSDHKYSNSARNYFYNIVRRNIATSTIQSEDRELDKYLRTPVEPDVEPLICLRAHETDDYLVIQSTGVPAGETFSIAGLITGKLRNKSLSDTACATVCLKSWISEEMGINRDNE
nr:12967_t:CDS:2 [Entrophospora candida]